MRGKLNRTQILILTAVVVAGALLVWYLQGAGRKNLIVDVTVPELTAAAKEGRSLFESNCAACHGKNAAGSQNGPPLVHVIYEPGHHGDYSFVMAVKNGTRAHHWGFGNMPPVPGIADEKVALITRYVRELQRANGIN